MPNRSKVVGFHGVKNKPSRNVFDLSHRNLFTAKIGELLPVVCQEMNPGDTIKISSDWFTRTAPLQQAAFTRLRENIQYFFVPYYQLWKYFDSSILNMTKGAAGQDISRIAASIKASVQPNSQMPYIPLDVLQQLVTRLATRDSSISDSQSDENTVWYNGPQCRHVAMGKLLQLLGYGEQPFMNTKHVTGVLHTVSSNLPNVSIFPLLAYQKIVQEHYRYNQWQPYQAHLCNIDYITPTSSHDISSYDMLLNVVGGESICDLQYSNLPLDYLNGVLPAPQFGSESVATISGGVVRLTQPILAGFQGSVQANSPLVTKGSGSSSISIGTASSPVTSIYGSLSSQTTTGVSVSQLRSSLALQKYKEIQLFNDPDIQSQIEAHFGIRPKHADSERSYFVGGGSSMIDINPVVNQALLGIGSESAAANTAAAPTGNGQCGCKYTADNYGLFIGIYRCTPVLDYAHVGLDRSLLKTDASDFVIPELDSIGMQQNYAAEVCAFNHWQLPEFTQSQNFATTYGYSPRYAHLKCSYDRYNGDFLFSRKDWVTGLDYTQLSGFFFRDNFAATLAPKLFQCMPDICKNIFFDQKEELISDDKLMIGLFNGISMVRKLSRHGLPYLR